jgi:hypothetical protein
MSIGYVLAASFSGLLGAIVWLILADGIGGAVLCYFLASHLTALTLILRRWFSRAQAGCRPCPLHQSEMERG